MNLEHPKSLKAIAAAAPKQHTTDYIAPCHQLDERQREIPQLCSTLKPCALETEQ